MKQITVHSFNRTVQRWSKWCNFWGRCSQYVKWKVDGLKNSMGCTTQLFKEGLYIQTDKNGTDTHPLCLCVCDWIVSELWVYRWFSFSFLLIYRFIMRKKLKQVSGETFCPLRRFPVLWSSEMLSPGAFRLCFLVGLAGRSGWAETHVPSVITQ